MLFSSELHKELKQLYRKWPEIKRFMRTLGCEELLAEDIFQEALLIYSRKRSESDFVLTVPPFFYVKNTCKLLYYNHARKKENKLTDKLDGDLTQPEETWLEKETKLIQVEKAVQQLGEQCREILHLFYNLGWNLMDIAQKIGLRNEKVAKVQKYRCIQKAKEFIQEIPEVDIKMDRYGN